MILDWLSQSPAFAKITALDDWKNYGLTWTWQLVGSTSKVGTELQLTAVRDDVPVPTEQGSTLAG
jgi:hypothetical protein